jgi:hypothetical protein
VDEEGEQVAHALLPNPPSHHLLESHTCPRDMSFSSDDIEAVLRAVDRATEAGEFTTDVVVDLGELDELGELGEWMRKVSRSPMH